MTTSPARVAWHILNVLLLLSACWIPAEAAAAEAHARGRTAAANAAQFEHVIHVSVDGLRPDAIVALGPRRLPHFYRLRVEGAYTDNARTDYDYTNTLPNHACELTGRPVLGKDGHGITFNTDDGSTLEQNHGSYVAGVFDVVHDNGFGTGMYVSKDKFALFERSWDGVHGAPDTIGTDNGRDKIDTYVYDPSTPFLENTLISNMKTSPHRYAFMHLTDLDTAGHSHGWLSPEYNAALAGIDGLVGGLLDLIDRDTVLAGKTAIVLTADHGGSGTDHSNPALAVDYTVPFYVWGQGIPAGADIYSMNEGSRLDPGVERPTYTDVPQPVRNGEAADLALDLLGLGPVPGASMDFVQDLAVSLPGGAAALPSVSITSPPESTVVDATAPCTVSVIAEATTGSIVAVEFFDNYVKVGTDVSAPYSWTFEREPLGPHRITARAKRSDGAASAASVDVEVTSFASVPAGHTFRMPPPKIFPNPVDRVTSIEFSLERNEAVDVGVYDLLGRRVRRLFGGELGEGAHSLMLDAGSMAPGIYFIMLRSQSEVRASKLMVVR